jgi:hypothetical protein
LSTCRYSPTAVTKEKTVKQPLSCSVPVFCLIEVALTTTTSWITSFCNQQINTCLFPYPSTTFIFFLFFPFFRYVLTTLDQLVAEDYVLVYFHGATPKSCIPRFSWVKNCYQMIDRRLRKNLKRLYLVHPTLWLKAAVLMCRPFIRFFLLIHLLFKKCSNYKIETN